MCLLNESKAAPQPFLTDLGIVAYITQPDSAYSSFSCRVRRGFVRPNFAFGRDWGCGGALAAAAFDGLVFWPAASRALPSYEVLARLIAQPVTKNTFLGRTAIASGWVSEGPSWDGSTSTTLRFLPCAICEKTPIISKRVRWILDDLA